MSTHTDASTTSPATPAAPSQPHDLQSQPVGDRKRPELTVCKRRISHRQEVAVANLLRFPTICRAAKASRVSERTMRRWMARPAFAARLESAKRTMLERAVDSLVRGSERCASELVKLASNPKVSEGARVRACVKTLEFVVRAVQIRAVEERLAQIEATLKLRQLVRRPM